MARSSHSLHPQHVSEALGHARADKRIDILRRIGEVGSISQAARDAGVSYKAAWQAVETLSGLAGRPLVEKAVGGPGGGGARLTQAGVQLLGAAERLQAARTAALSKKPTTQLDPRSLGALALRTSMRNTLPCTVHRVQSIGGASIVQMRLSDGQTLTSRITRESAQLLGLHQGLEVLALFKATAVAVAALTESAPLPSCCLHGTLSRLPSCEKAGEASLVLPDGLPVVGFVAAQSGLRAGQAAWACLDASAVVIALPG